MSIRAYLILQCDSDSCSDSIRLPIEIGKRAIRYRAENAGWFKYCDSHFCPKCRGRIEQFLEGKNEDQKCESIGRSDE